MRDRFTDRCRKVMALANQVAIKHGHEHIGSGHMLLGLVIEGAGVGASVLKNILGDLAELQKSLSRLMANGGEPQAGVAKKVLEASMEEARLMNHKYVGTEHLLLGFLSQPDCIAAKSLANLGLSPDQLREDVHDLLGDKRDEG